MKAIVLRWPFLFLVLVCCSVGALGEDIDRDDPIDTDEQPSVVEQQQEPIENPTDEDKSGAFDRNDEQDAVMPEDLIRNVDQATVADGSDSADHGLHKSALLAALSKSIGEDNTDQQKAQDEDDYRTLLDISGQVAKDYLTQQMIPATDKECRWDWRSLRCEPHCQCDFRLQTGDYHLGRACRLKEEDTLSGCVPIDPSQRWQNQPATRRLVSLVRQTLELLQARLRQWKLWLQDFMEG